MSCELSDEKVSASLVTAILGSVDRLRYGRIILLFPETSLVHNLIVKGEAQSRRSLQVQANVSTGTREISS
jgi:hypothetical protein